MQASLQPQVFLDLRYKSPSQVLAASVHRQLTGAVSQPHGKMSATTLMSMESAALPSQPASKLSCVHPCISCTTFLLLSTFVLSCQGLSGRFERPFIPRIDRLSSSMAPGQAYAPAPVYPLVPCMGAAMPEPAALIYENGESQANVRHPPPAGVAELSLGVGLALNALSSLPGELPGLNSSPAFPFPASLVQVLT